MTCLDQGERESEWRGREESRAELAKKMLFFD